MAVDQASTSDTDDPLPVLDTAINLLTDRKKDTQSEITVFKKFQAKIQEFPVQDPRSPPSQDQLTESETILADILETYHEHVTDIRNFDSYTGTTKEYFKEQFSDELVLALSQSRELYSPIATQLEKEIQRVIRSRDELLSDTEDELDYVKQTRRLIKRHQKEMGFLEDEQKIDFSELIDHYEELEERSNEIETRISERQTMIHERDDVKHEFFYQMHEYDYPVLAGLSVHLDNLDDRLTELTDVISSHA